MNKTILFILLAIFTSVYAEVHLTPKENEAHKSDKLDTQKQRDLQEYYKQLQLNMTSLETRKQLELQKYYEQLQLNIENSCGKLKSDKMKYQECIEKNFPSKNYGMYGGLGKSVTGPGMYGGSGANSLPNMGLGFCSPNHDESTCQTADGRVYRLDNSVNQLQRHMEKEQSVGGAAFENKDSAVQK